jgi:hypothetical protein
MSSDLTIRDTMVRSPGFAGLERIEFKDNPAATRAFEQVSQMLSTRFGARSPFLERAVTWNDLNKYGFAKLRDASGGIVDPGSGSPFPDPIPVPADPNLDPTVPPAPTGFAVTGAVTTNILEWDTVWDTLPYFGQTEVWRSSTDNLSTAVPVGQTRASLYADAIGQESVSYFYWIRHVSKAGNAGPYNDADGTEATTSAGSAASVADGSITTAKLANLAVATAKIANGAIVNAKIGDAEITNVKIADATIQSAKIVSLSAGKITAGAIAVGEYIQSFNYNPGVAGWRIHGDGSGEFSNVTVRGAVFASSGSFTGTVSASTITGGTISGTNITGGTISSPDIIGGVVRNSTATRFVDLTDAPLSGYMLFSAGAKILADGSTEFSNRIGGPSLAATSLTWLRDDPYTGPGGSSGQVSGGEGY